ncbi:hypothetical protein RDI58_009213 [Solanum bulbocastanum]|uniref:MYB transcription factor n=2 Tax=Solanum TaxID=4107 RepID=A0AAN8U3E2_SOLBU
MSFLSKSSSSSSCDDDIELRRGPWTIEEDKLLVHYITNHGEGRWNMLAKHAGLKRTGKSCRLRWLNYLKPDVKRGNLTPQEQLLILELHSKLGNRWSKIAQYLPGRTDNEIKNYWRTRVQKQARNLKIDSNSAAFQEMIRSLWIPRLLQKIQSSSVTPSIQSSQSSTPPGFSTSTSSNSSSHSSSIYNSPKITSECPEIPPREMDDSDLNSFVKAHFPFDYSYEMDNFGQLATGNFNDMMDYDQMSEDQNKLTEQVIPAPSQICPPSPNAQRSVKMYTSKQKIHKDKDAEPSEFEVSVGQALFDLENTNQELKSELKDLYINSAVQIDVSGNRKAVVIHVPYRLRKAFRKVHVRLVRELEKKFSGKDVIFIATRRIVRPPKRGSAAQRPRTRTLTSVHDAMLEDLVVPAEIVGKRTRYRVDGSKIMKVYLDPKERNNTEYKLETLSAVYRKLSGKDVVFEYPITEA